MNDENKTADEVIDTSVEKPISDEQAYPPDQVETTGAQEKEPVEPVETVAEDKEELPIKAEEVKRELESTPDLEPADEIKLTRGQLKSILDEIDSLKGEYKKPRKVTENVARLRFYKDYPVVWYGNVRDLLDKETGKLVAWMDIQLHKKEDFETVRYLDFLNATGEYSTDVRVYQVSIKKQEAKKHTVSQGSFKTTNLNPAFDKEFESRQQDMEVTSYEYRATVTLLEGPSKGIELVVPSLSLNS